MTQTFLDTLTETFPSGVTKIQIQKGRWTFNNKQIKNCIFPVQMVFEKFIKTQVFRIEVVESRSITPSHSVIATRETFYAHSHLKSFNHQFKFPNRTAAATGESYSWSDYFPEFISKSN